jgi:poly-gamma-glutamate capsule biosynthesis protein CapA/YwtB (metallophosphatase superfamily)
VAPDPAELRAARLACERIDVAAVGDLMIGTDFPQDRLPPDDGRGQLADAAPLLAGADIAFGNVEGVLMDGGEPVKKCKDPSACYLFRSPARFAGTFATAGFTVMSLANNHARDFGEEGRSSSMAALAGAGIRHSGREGDVASWQVGESRVAMIAFSPFSGSWPMLDMDAGRRAVAALAADHDVVIVSFHGGAEGAGAERIPFSTERYYGEDRGDVVQFARGMVDAGADLVIGHGPHVPRALEVYRQRLVAYSLGNFATYYGISVADAKGYAPLLTATVDGSGRFLEGNVASMIQRRPDGPRLDPQQRAWRMMMRLTREDFPDGALELRDDGGFEPRDPGPGPDCPAQ